MSLTHTPDPIVDPERLFEGFENLMPFRVQDILLVSSLYDSFILREDGRLNELLIGESLELNLSADSRHHPCCPRREALALARSQPTLQPDRHQPRSRRHGRRATRPRSQSRWPRCAGRRAGLRLSRDQEFSRPQPSHRHRAIFLWQGNVRILISIVKYIEDKRNVLHDTRAIGVPVILVVEDNIRYYSSFLPTIYTELITQSRRLLSEGLNVAHKLVRMRARPKILLASNYEDAAQQVMKYREYLLGVVSDVEFPRNGQLSPDAGFELARMVRAEVPDAPIVLQTSRTEFRARAHAEGYSFLRKRSPTLLRDLRRFLTEQFGFGDFVFRLPNGQEVARARDLNELEVPAGRSAGGEHRLPQREKPFLALAVGENRVRPGAKTQTTKGFRLPHARKLAPRPDQVHCRIPRRTKPGSDRRFQRFHLQSKRRFFLRIGGGSLGGKARGLAFVRHLLHKYQTARRFSNVHIAVPPSVVLATDMFDRFLNENNLLDFAIGSSDDAEILRRFLEASLPASLRDDLLAFLAEVHYPLAVRSSSLLEDSQYQPFTGVYETFMLANQHRDLLVRLEQLMEAIKRVYASTFSQHAKGYVRATPYRLEEEKMAVIVQQVVGTIHSSHDGQRFYPDFSGVVRSHNFYPVPPMSYGDGIAAVALGLGRAVVDGGKCLTFCPRYPRNIMQFSSVEDILANSQREFWALELDHMERLDESASDPLLEFKEARFGLDVAEKDGTLDNLGSTYSVDNHVIYDGLNRPGTRIVSFAPILKHGVFPLASILERLTRIGDEAFGRPVEVEFAVKLPQGPRETAEFGFLQIRPLVLSREGEELRMEDVSPERLVCHSAKVLGNGRVPDLRDVVVVDFHRFERARSQEVAEGVAHFNATLSERGTPYLLIGVGRWGSNDPWLGIPVEWDEISGARVIVEAGFRDFRVTPSQGSHFFQNLTAFQVGYFTVNPDAGEGFVDWEWLGAVPAVEEQGCVRHLHFDAPLVVVMNGKTSQGMVFKPELA